MCCAIRAGMAAFLLAAVTPSTPRLTRATLCWEFASGRVLTDEHGKGILRGTYEMDIDIIPLDEYWIRGGQYSGGSIPSSSSGISPTVARSHHISRPSAVRCSATTIFRRATLHKSTSPAARRLARRSFARAPIRWDIALKAYHLSNASIGNRNPGLNASLQLMLGYTWH